MDNNAEQKPNDILLKIKTALRKVRKEIINTMFPLRDQWISDQFKDQKIYNDWTKECIFYHESERKLLEEELKSELRLLKKELSAERSSNEALREELAIIKRIFPNFFPTPEKENEVLEPEEKKETEKDMEAVIEAPSKQETVIDINEKETNVLENPKEKKKSVFAKLFKTKPANVVGKDEQKRGFFARLFKM